MEYKGKLYGKANDTYFALLSTTDEIDEVKEILNNVIYWDGCPESYKEKIIRLLKKL